MLRGAAQVGIDQQSLMSRLGHRHGKVGDGRTLAFIGRGRTDNQRSDWLLKRRELDVRPQGAEGFGGGGSGVLQSNELRHRALSLLRQMWRRIGRWVVKINEIRIGLSLTSPLNPLSEFGEG